jgi:hypothetical protein
MMASASRPATCGRSVPWSWCAGRWFLVTIDVMAASAARPAGSRLAWLGTFLAFTRPCPGGLPARRGDDAGAAA